MDAGTVLFLAAVLACPLLMLLVHRGGHHGHSAGAHAGHGAGHDLTSPTGEASLAELRARQEELAAEISALEARHEAEAAQQNQEAAGTGGRP